MKLVLNLYEISKAEEDLSVHFLSVRTPDGRILEIPNGGRILEIPNGGHFLR